MKMDEATLSIILDSIYDAAVSYEAWPSALQKLAAAFQCGSVALIDRDLQTMRGRVLTTGIDSASQLEFLNVWSARDILRQRTKAWRPGAIETDQHILPRSELLASDYYNGFMKPRDMDTTMRLTLVRENRFLKIITMIRPRSAGAFGADEVEQCRRLMPHLLRAASISSRTEEADLMVGTFSNLLDQSSAGLVLVNQRGEVKYANRAARAMAQATDVFVLRRRRIEAVNPRDDACLQNLIAGAVGRLERADAARGGVIRLSSKSRKADLTAIVSPLAKNSSWFESGPMAYIAITDTNATSLHPQPVLRQLFNLTSAEARVAERLMMGDGTEQAASALDIRISTLRWHLASLYRKTGTSRQAELMRLLLSLPAI